MRYEFGSTGERDAFIGREFPERAGDENVPGLYRLPDGRELSVFCNVVTVVDARRRKLVQEWMGRAEQLERYAAQCRREGCVQGPEGAEDAEAAARDYRQAAEEVDV